MTMDVQQAQVSVAALTFSSVALALVAGLWVLTIKTRRGWMRSPTSYSNFLTHWKQVPPPLGYPYAAPLPVLKWRPRVVNLIYIVATLCLFSYACTMVSSFKYSEEKPEEQKRNTISLSMVLAVSYTHLTLPTKA